MCSPTFPAAAAALFKAGQKNVVYIWCGTDNIANGFQSASTTYATLSSYIAGAHAAGFTVITATMLSRESPTGFESVREQFNNLMRANSASADVVVDFDPTVLGCSGCANNTTYFVDKIHVNNVGEYDYIVPAMQAVLP